MYEETCYKNAFLKEVFLRIDFPSPLKGLDKTLPANVSKSALKQFPIAEPQKGVSQELQFTGSSIQATSSELVQWAFHGHEREKSLIINPTSIVLTTRKYITYELLVEDITDVITEFYKTYKDLSASRVGLRYINIIEPNDEDPLAWSEYINEGMLGIIDFHENKDCITRAFHILDYNFDGQSIKYQFGIANPDYPAIIKRKQFVLDIDSFFNGAFELQEILGNVDLAHEKIQDFFEKSVTDKTRELMKPTEND